MLNRLLGIFMGDIEPEHRKAFTRIFFRGLFLVHIAWACGWLATSATTADRAAGTSSPNP